MEYNFFTLPIELKLELSYTSPTGNIVARADLISHIPNYPLHIGVDGVMPNDFELANPVMVMQEVLTLMPTLCDQFLKHFSELKSCDKPLAEIILKRDK